MKKSHPEVWPCKQFLSAISIIAKTSRYDESYFGLDKTPKEQYYLHADGRDDGLDDIDPDDPGAFRSRLTDHACYGGHPWEVVGGETPPISVYTRFLIRSARCIEGLVGNGQARACVTFSEQFC